MSDFPRRFRPRVGPLLATLLVMAPVGLLGDPPDAASGALPSTPAGRMLGAWLEAHNSADADRLAAWMRASFAPEALAGRRFDEHLAFYVEATRMFGELAAQPLRVMENEPHRLVVQLPRIEVVGEAEPDPDKVIVVEVDIDPDDPRYLARGLGMGSLYCELREGRD